MNLYTRAWGESIAINAATHTGILSIASPTNFGRLFILLSQAKRLAAEACSAPIVFATSLGANYIGKRPWVIFLQKLCLEVPLLQP